ncbi:MAG TPA: hypothetical protein VG734_09680 [Lacunisphaera sp.]|nr:hypothetical protein [Lacunisphaera sp.]
MQLSDSQRVRWAVLGFGVLIFFVLPPGVAVMNDDFGYLRSVIETVHRHRPWTDDWLESWSASLATISAILYRISGSFQLATQGLQVIGSIAACAGAYALCRSRDISPRASLFISMLGLTYPPLLWKSIEYTVLVVYVPCLLWAIWAADRRRWGMFYLALAIAFTSRQSAVAWLVLPLAEVLNQLARAKNWKVAWSRPAVVLWGALAAYVVLSLGMNETQSQRMVTQHVLERLQPATALRNLGLGLGVGAVFAGLGALVLQWRPAGLPVARNLPARIVAVLLVGAALFSCIEKFPRVFAEHPNFEGWSGLLYSNLVIAAGLGGLLLSRVTVRWELVAACLAAAVLVSLRADVWDYYFADVAILAFFCVSPSRSIEATEVWPRLPRGAGVVGVLIFAAFHLWFVFEQKCRVDRDFAVSVISEKALRAGEIEVCDIGDAPYGFVGWHLHRYFVEHDGENDPDIGGFMRYQRSGAVERVLSPMRFWPDSKSLGALGGEPGTRVIRSEVFRVAWLWHQRVSLLRPASPGQIQPGRLAFDRAKYRPALLPLTNQEWREYIEATGN